MKLSQLAWAVATLTAIGTSTAGAEGNPKNGLSDFAFKQSALLTNPAAMAALAANPLTSATLASDALKWQLHDPNARAALTEIVKCALGPSQTLAYVDPVNSSTYYFGGELGMCQSTYAGDWATGRALLTCQQLVSACVIARVNVVEKSVPISLRNQLTPAATRSVPVETEYREDFGPMTYDPADGAIIGVFDSNSLFGTDFGWKPAFVGTCDPGSVYLRPTDSTYCTTPTRVCDGLEGCLPPDGGGWTLPPGATDPTSMVPSTLSSCTTKFTCPASGTFSMMAHMGGLFTAPTYTRVGGTSPHVSYPATEAQVFTFREGAFYGNLFDPAAPPSWTCSVDPAHPEGVYARAVRQSPYCANPHETIPYPHIYACYSAGVENQGWSGTAYENSRLCVTGQADCYPTPLARCWTSGTNLGRCQWNATDGVFYNCLGLGGDTTTYVAVTTYLNKGTAELTGDGETIRTRDRGDGSEVTVDDSAGCSAGGSGGLASIALALGFVVRRRQRA